MKILKKFFGLVLLASLVAGCEAFEDLTPEFVTFRMDGPAGETVSIVYSKQFVAGVDETQVTQVEVFRADTVLHTLPFDTIIDVRLERRIFFQGEVAPLDTLSVDVEIDVDGRVIFDRTGDLLPDVPWVFLYQFNTVFTDAVEVVI